jgi:predicted peroxiredoxin
VSEEYDLQFIVASGPRDVQRAVFAFAAALAAAHSGSRVVVALTMQGAHWAADSEGKEAMVHGFPPVAELIEMVQEAGAKVEACSTCIENYCPAPVGEDGLKVLGYGITRVGLGLIAMRMTHIPTTMC